VEKKGTGEFVGDVGFADYKREIQPSLKGIPEIGWVLANSAHGKGYATEAVEAALAWGDGNFEDARTVCIVAPDNLASIRVAGKCGFREFEQTSYHGNAVILFERRRA